MLTEEAHHMFVGETGIGRVVKRTLEGHEGTGHRRPGAHPRARRGGPRLLQKYLNFLVLLLARPVRLEISSNSAANFANG
jgi:benzoyl-CoA 2,3-dioxygenase component B